MRHLASGLRRQVPVPVHGASISTRSARPSRSAQHVGLAARRAHLDIARAGTRDALVDRRQLALVDIGGVDLAAILHRRRQRQRLAAGAGGNDRSPARRVLHRPAARQAASPRPGFRSQPLRNSGSAWMAGLLASAASRMRSPIGDHRVGSAPRCASFGTISSRSALSVLTRRSSGARLASAAPSGAALVAEHARKMRIEPFADIRPQRAAAHWQASRTRAPPAPYPSTARAQSARRCTAPRSPRHRGRARDAACRAAPHAGSPHP